MSKQTRRVFSTAVKEVVVLRVAAGERVAAVALELGVQRKLLYEWWRAWEKLGIAGLNRRRGPGLWRASASAAAAPASPDASGALALAQQRIAELERKIGQQQVDLDFFRKALRPAPAPEPAAGVTGSTRSSQP